LFFEEVVEPSRCLLCGERCKLVAITRAFLTYCEYADTALDDTAKGILLLNKLEIERHMKFLNEQKGLHGNS
jgi:hypothetical protein